MEMEGGTERRLPKTDDHVVDCSTADEEHSVFVRKLQLFYIFWFHLYIFVMFTWGLDDANHLS